jgi:hypothetical protein
LTPTHVVVLKHLFYLVLMLIGFSCCYLALHIDLVLPLPSLCKLKNKDVESIGLELHILEKLHFSLF